MLSRGVFRLSIWLAIIYYSVESSATSFSDCHSRVQGILDGTIKYKNITNLTIHDYNYLYDGPVWGLDQRRLPRNKFLALTYEGCRAICGSGVSLNDANKALTILTSWVVPVLALMASFPYDSLKEGDLLDTWCALAYRIGSPQTTFAATVSNLHHTKMCRLASDNRDQVYRDVYYVLSCINQYDIFGRVGQERIEDMIRIILHGLWLPLGTLPAGGSMDGRHVRLAKDLIHALAFKMRMLRRRGVYPQVINIFWFLLAFILSLATAFKSLEDNLLGYCLAISLLLLWLPVLVIVALVDRNPVVPDRCRELFKRWIYNVNAIISPRPPLGEKLDLTVAPLSPNWWRPGLTQEENQYPLGGFIGQGRRLQHYKFSNAVAERMETLNLGEGEIVDFRGVVRELCGSVNRHCNPQLKHWFASQFLVSINIFMAFTVSFVTPTFGWGCRSSSYFLFWVLTLPSSIVQLWPRQIPRWAINVFVRPFQHAAAIWLILIIIFQITGVYNNCWCKSSLLGLGGYMDFETAEFYRDYFHIYRYWATAAAVGAVTCVGYLVWAVVTWVQNSALWAGREVPGRPEYPDILSANRAGGVDMLWLDY